LLLGKRTAAGHLAKRQGVLRRWSTHGNGNCLAAAQDDGAIEEETKLVILTISGEERSVFESEFEQEMYAQRREKLRQIEALGQAAYPNQFQATATVPEILQRFDSATAEALEAERTNVVRVVSPAGPR
jgi:hypothetical protein